MADIPKWKIGRNVEPVQVSVQDALTTARLFQSQRLTTDDVMYDRWLTGEMEYPALQEYFRRRAMQVTGPGEAEQLTVTERKAEEKQQDIQDEFMANRFNNGHASFSEFDAYLRSRLTQEQPNTPQWQTLQGYVVRATEVTRGAEEDLWKSQYENGRLSYEDYAAKLADRSSLYAPGTERYTKLQERSMEISPEYQLQQALNAYLRMDFSPNSRDVLENLQGYQNELRRISNGYTANSQQRLLIEQKVSEVGKEAVDYQIARELQTLSSDVNVKYSDLTNADNAFKQRQAVYDANPTQENYAALQQAYTDWQNRANAFSTAKANYEAKYANMNNPNNFVAPAALQQALGYQVQQPAAPTPPAPAAPQQTVQLPTAPPAQTQTPPSSPAAPPAPPAPAQGSRAWYESQGFNYLGTFQSVLDAALAGKYVEKGGADYYAKAGQNVPGNRSYYEGIGFTYLGPTAYQQAVAQKKKVYTFGTDKYLFSHV